MKGCSFSGLQKWVLKLGGNSLKKKRKFRIWGKKCSSCRTDFFSYWLTALPPPPPPLSGLELDNPLQVNTARIVHELHEWHYHSSSYRTLKNKTFLYFLFLFCLFVPFPPFSLSSPTCAFQTLAEKRGGGGRAHSRAALWVDEAQRTRGVEERKYRAALERQVRDPARGDTCWALHLRCWGSGCWGLHVRLRGSTDHCVTASQR